MSFVVTAALAKQYAAKLLLRIDDLDAERVRPGHVQDIFDSLEWLGISTDEGPQNEYELNQCWSQLVRVAQYDALVKRLQQAGHLYECACSRKEIADRGGLISMDHHCRNTQMDPKKTDVNWRIRLPETCVIDVVDGINGKISVDLNKEMPDFVVRKRDGMPSYQIASLADDLHFKVDLIVRGADLIASTAAQCYLAALLNRREFASSIFIHHPLMKALDGRKLSKSDGSEALKTMRHNGAQPELIFERIAGSLGIDRPVKDLNSFAYAFDAQLHLRG